MTEQELREKIIDILQGSFKIDLSIRSDLRIPLEEKADQILALIKEAGYVKLAEDQSLPIPKGMFLDGHSDDKYITQDSKATAVSEATQQDMLKANFRKVE